MRRVIFAICGVLIVGAVCSARQFPPAKPAPVQHQPGMLLDDRTPTPSASYEGLVALVAQQIVQKHLKSVAVIGAAGPMPDLPTQFGLEFGDKFSAAPRETIQRFSS